MGTPATDRCRSQSASSARPVATPAPTAVDGRSSGIRVSCVGVCLHCPVALLDMPNAEVMYPLGWSERLFVYIVILELRLGHVFK